MNKFEPIPSFLQKESENCPAWIYFNQIRQIPRPSKKEKSVINHIISLAKQMQYKYHTDRAGNLVVFVPSTIKSDKIICLQGHMDMVCQKTEDKKHNFEKDPIQLIKEGNFIRADRTTLGADDGIGISYMIALMMDRKINHPALELLFTADEETGLTGI